MENPYCSCKLTPLLRALEIDGSCGHYADALSQVTAGICALCLSVSASPSPSLASPSPHKQELS